MIVALQERKVGQAGAPQRGQTCGAIGFDGVGVGSFGGSMIRYLSAP